MSVFQIRNECLTVQIQDLGAQMWSVRDAEGTEYLWQGDAKYWEDRAPNLFPYIARLTDGKYQLSGKTYGMDIHGFAKDTVFEAEQKSDSHIIFKTQDTEETYRQYPYKFVFSISYELADSKLLITYHVKNLSDKEMYFGVGGHPGFQVPFAENTVFEDYYLEFDKATDVKRVGMSKDCFVTGEDTPFVLEEGIRLPLCHSLFDDDAIILTDMAKRVKLASEKVGKEISVTYPDMTYLGIWHRPRTDAPYICIEPWSSLPSRKGIVEDLETQPGLISLAAGDEYRNQFEIEVREHVVSK